MNAQLTTRLRHLRLSGMVEALPGRVAQAEAAPLPHLEFLELLVEDELAFMVGDCDVEVLLTEDAPSPRHPLGIKGAGEGGINGVGGVIASAIDDAIGLPGAVTQLPVTPQRMRELLRRYSR